jgi:hypothetical protein
MDIGSEIRKNLGDDWIPGIYAEKVRTQRTRSYSLDITEKENRVEILYTLLGIELKAGNKRFACPDLATARYLQVFARIGCRDFAVPYDITRISTIADQMETAWQRLLLLIDSETKGSSAQSRARIRSGLLRAIRNAITERGAGDIMPEFRQTTKQRTN